METSCIQLLTFYRCYDVCTSAPPYTSPPCSLSSTAPSVDTSTTDWVASTETSGYAIFTATPEPGAAYTTEPPADSIAPATDGSKALVMAEMPKADADDPDAGTFRIAHMDSEQAAAAVAEAPALIEAPQSLRGAAIAKLLADKDRKPNTENKPCWDSPTCKEVQLGIPSPLPSSVEPSSGAASAPTSEPSEDPQLAPGSPTDNPADAPVDAPGEAPAEPQSSSESSAESPTDAPAEVPTEAPADTPVDVPAEAPEDALPTELAEELPI